MEHNNIASIEGENMILCDTDTSASTEFNVPDVETTMVQVSQPMDMEEEDAINDAVLGRESVSDLIENTFRSM